MTDKEKPKGPQFSIKLELVGPDKEDDAWKTVALATVLFRGRYAPRPPRDVVFEIADIRIGGVNFVSRETTDDDSGQASVPIPIENPGNYRITAYLADLPGVRASKPILIKEEKPAQPPRVKDLRVWAPGGKDGKYKLSISVVGEDGRPAKGAMVRVFDGEGKEVVHTPTNEHGTIDPTPEVEVHEHLGEIVVDVMGTELEQRLRLAGPHRWRKPPDVPEPPASSTGSFSDALRWAWDEAKKARKGGTP
ncbi:hypothetical protein HY573_02405 [Candidatus Parcubacteria bacterium]|nr:hypothetical protein [Candidatus Parcubacteria bacterium]